MKKTKSILNGGVVGFAWSLALWFVMVLCVTIYTLIKYGFLMCVTFGGSFKCDVVGYAAVVLGFTAYYFIFVTLPFILIGMAMFGIRKK